MDHRKTHRSLVEAYERSKESTNLMAKALEEVMWAIPGPGDRSGIPSMALDMVERNPASDKAKSQAAKAAEDGHFKYIASGDYYLNYETGNTYPEEGHEGGDPKMVKAYPDFIDWIQEVADKEIF